MRLPPSLVPLGFLVSLAVAHAEVSLAPLFTDHAVLQRDKPVPVWGRADAGEKVTVTFGRQTKSVTAGPDGRWTVSLDKLSAESRGADLTVAGTNTVVLHDVVVGEVWLCSGQSNMEFKVNRARDAAKEIAGAHFPLIRHVTIKRAVSGDPVATVGTSGWLSASPATVGDFTAVGYFFARDIFEKLKIPIGLVHSSWGGTPIESWMPAPALARESEFKVVAERWEKMLADYPEKKAEFDAALAEWAPAEAAARAQGAGAHAAWLKAHPKPRAPRGAGDSWTPSGLFNGMIAPLAPYALRGTLWYQGESNAEHASEYRQLFVAMINAWRKQFGQGDLPFLWVNLANYKVPGDPTNQTYAYLREAQSQALDVENTGQAVTIDIGDPDDIHPTNKQEVGRRLALIAKNRIYRIAVEDSGPMFANVRFAGGALVVTFAHSTGGLVARDHPLDCVEIAGEDQVFHPATVSVNKSVMVALSPLVKQPVAIRYAWRNAPDANLYNGVGLPAVPFRSDNW
jgi:sialate O-acetylesterase